LEESIQVTGSPTVSLLLWAQKLQGEIPTKPLTPLAPPKAGGFTFRFRQTSSETGLEEMRNLVRQHKTSPSPPRVASFDEQFILA
jgi:hypothetical protein